ncbi:tetratricopeptide repeat protein [Marinicella sp. W31]|uniref:tetratricopeptide repeat protein n=1 Tax=Marinicella sp. W31 TaxID=3023713 RepID=UPI003757E300
MAKARNEPLSQKVHQKAKKILNKILDLPADERQDYLELVCAQDHVVRQEVESLLAFETEEFMEQPLLVNMRDSMSQHQLKPAPGHIGPFKIIETLGEGGMGRVYLAEQTEPMERQVAIKVMHAMDEEKLRSRFTAEWQNLARLNHPNIAALFDVGLTDDDEPYVIMEYVEGDLITDWCDQNKLTLKQRLQLFLKVCAGVGHAHEKSILHCDIKPSNVIVTDIDGEPVPKLIDFGVAQVLSSGSAVESAVMAGSPSYMSPEALKRKKNQLDLDTRSDVYSLGVVLFRLLVGVLPKKYKLQSLKTVLQDLPHEQKHKILAVRKTYARQAQNYLKGDLSKIVLKALSKDREKRYRSPGTLADDIQAFLQDKPITASEPTWHYVLGKFIKRQWVAAAFGALLLLSLMGGIVANRIEAEKAKRSEADAKMALSQSQELTKFLTGLFETLDPEEAHDSSVSAKVMLDRAVEKIEQDIENQPQVKARFLQTIGVIYTKMSLFEEAEKAIRESLSIRTRWLTDGHPERLESLNQLAVIYRNENRLDDASKILDQVLSQQLKNPNTEPVQLAQTYNNIGNVHRSKGQFLEAETAHLKALEIRQDLPDEFRSQIADSMNNLATLYWDRRILDKAKTMYESAEKIYTETLEENNPLLGVIYNNLGNIAENEMDYAQAESNYFKAVALWEKAYGSTNARSVLVRTNLARFYERRGRLEDAISMWQDILAKEKEAGNDNRHQNISFMGRSYGYAGDKETALKYFSEAQSVWNNSKKQDPQHSGLIWVRQGDMLAQFEDYAAAEKAYKNSLGMLYLKTPTIDRHKVRVWGQQIELYLKTGQILEAQELIDKTVTEAQRIYGERHYRYLEQLNKKSKVALALGEINVAEATAQEGLDKNLQSLGKYHRFTAYSYMQLGEVRRAQGQIDLASEAYRNALDILEKVYYLHHPQVVKVSGVLQSIEKERS